MSEQGERMCPLCAEEMDLTDQQLKPCKCGYEICVWCWHHIMDMAEKDEADGRCPACRKPYDKERIVGMAANCERLMAETSTERKSKLQKAKSKATDGRKQLSSLRVIQRNLVYIVGLPINLADEDLLQRKEYFGQYGRVLKVSISRTSGGAIQHFQNNTCSVYITYSKEDEAVRCIQIVHGFILEGRPLRACFGTTKYCHAWLRNVQCNNPDCLYLHEIGPQEDSFSKDEIISAYTRNRVQQIVTTTNNQQRRSGNVLPPPPDDSLPATFKPITKNASNNIASPAKASPPNDSSTKPVSLPATASWGTRASNSNSFAVGMTYSDGHVKHKSDGLTVSPPVSCADCRMHVTKFSDVGKGFPVGDPVQTGGELELVPSKEQSSLNFSAVVSDGFASTCGSILDSQTPFCSGYLENSGPGPEPVVNFSGLRVQFNSYDSEKDAGFPTSGNISNICAAMSSMSVSHDPNNMSGLLESNCQDQAALSKFCEPILDPWNFHESDELKTLQPGVDFQSVQRGNGICISDVCRSSLLHANDGCEQPAPCTYDNAVQSNRFIDHLSDFSRSVDDPYSNWNIDPIESYSTTVKDLGENSIISDILSMDFDTWNDSLESSQSLVSLLHDNKKHPSPLTLSSSRKAHKINQSRFSFAREEESRALSSEQEAYFDTNSKLPMFNNFGQNFLEEHKSSFTGHRNSIIYPSKYAEESMQFTSNPNIKNTVSRGQVSTPPGFSVPSRPPPGFFTHDGTESASATGIGARFHDNIPSTRSIIQAEEPLNVGGDDIGIIDPAILAIGKESVPDLVSSQRLDMNSFSNPLNSFRNEAHHQLFSPRPFMQHPDTRFPEIGNKSSVPSDLYRSSISSLGQHNVPQSAITFFSNGVWDPWSDIDSGSTLGMSELVRSERLGFRGLFNTHEGSGIHMSKSNHL